MGKWTAERTIDMSFHWKEINSSGLNIVVVNKSSLVQVMACCLFGAKLISDSMLVYSQLDRLGQISDFFSEILVNIQQFSYREN